MAIFFNFYGNYVKAKEYYLLEEINDKLCVENFDLKEEIEINLAFYKEVIDNLSHTVSEKDKEIQSLKDKLQKRDPKTGKFVKKKLLLKNIKLYG